MPAADFSVCDEIHSSFVLLERLKGFGSSGFGGLVCTKGALTIAYTISGVPYYDYSIMGPKTLFILITKAPIFGLNCRTSDWGVLGCSSRLPEGPRACPFGGSRLECVLAVPVYGFRAKARTPALAIPNLISDPVVM